MGALSFWHLLILLVVVVVALAVVTGIVVVVLLVVRSSRPRTPPPGAFPQPHGPIIQPNHQAPPSRDLADPAESRHHEERS